MTFNSKIISWSAAACGALLVALLPTGAHAVLVHKYTFNNGTANDSMGAAGNGTLVDPGGATAVFTVNGQLDLSANTGQASNAVTQDAYVDLPNGIVKAAALSGTSGAVTFEFWATVSTQRTWQRFGDFGTSSGGEDNPTDGNAANYMLISPNSGRTSSGLEMTNHVSNTIVGGGGEPDLGLTGPFPLGVEQHVVAVYDKTNTSGGANPGGTMSLYLNGALLSPGGSGVIGSGAIDPLFDLNGIVDNNNWLGRSQWGADPVFDGLYNEFRIYDHALTPAEVTADFNAGPDPVPLPTLIVNKTTGAVAIKNFSASPYTIDYYEIGSVDPDGPGGTPGGALSVAGWNSLSDQNIDGIIQGDFNGSGTVTGADLGVLRANFATGTTQAQGDADGNNRVDGNDVLIVQRQMGKVAGEGNSWDEGGGASHLKLSELFLNGGTTLAPNQQVSLGNAYDPSVFGGTNGNLTFKFGIRGQATLTPGSVQYVTAGPAVEVPEPAALASAAIAAGALLVRRRNRSFVGARFASNAGGHSKNSGSLPQILSSLRRS